jgi:hypothetical protein
MAKKSLLRGIVTTNLIPWTPVLAGLTQYDPENEELALIIRTVKRECSYSPRSNAGDIFCALAPTTKALRKGYPGDCFHPNEWHSFPFAKGVRL